jgi:L-ribulose-5-phosphate 3-epimerase
MRLGYNTNGFASHRIADVMAILADIGYQSVALTLDHNILDPPERSAVGRCVELIRPLIARHGLALTIETGARFILDPVRKHQPTLLSAAPAHRETRLEFLRAAIDVAAALSAESVSLWSGAPDDNAGSEELMSRLAQGLGTLLDYAHDRKVHLSFEPEPGMFIDTMDNFDELYRRVDHPLLGLTLDVGHIHCLGDGDVGEHVRRYRDILLNVHIEDMRRGVHEHLMFGEGEIDFAEVFAALRAIDYAGPVHVELPRHSHDAVEAARRSFRFLQ